MSRKDELIALVVAVGMILLGTIMLLAVMTMAGCERNVEPTFVDDPIELPHVPLVVAGVDGAGGDALEEAVKLWNREVGCAIFTLDAPERPADVIVDYDAPTSGQCAALCDPDRHLACTCVRPISKVWFVYYPSPSTVDVDLWVWAHELSHVLGLAHDVGRTNIVTRPDAHRGPAEGKPLLVSHKDATAVRKRYCR